MSHQPNILLVVLDAVRKDFLSVYDGDAGTTPALRALAEEGETYTDAFATAPWTPPSHASLFTGLYPSGHGAYGDTGLREDVETISGLLSEAGYKTFGFSNSFHTSASQGFSRGFDYYHDMLALPSLFDTPIECSPSYAKGVFHRLRYGKSTSYFQLEKLKRKLASSDDSFFGFINLNDAHSPYDPPDRFRSRVERDGDDSSDEATPADEQVVRRVSRDAFKFIVGDLEFGDAEWDLLRDWYAGEIAYADWLLGRLFNYLRESGVYDETLIVLTSDHGEHFGEYGLAYHQFSLSDILLNVPLIVKWPNGDRRGTRSGLTSLIDIAPTILEAVGAPVPERMAGYPLQSNRDHDYVFAEYNRPYPPLRERLRDEYGDAFDPFDRGLQAVRTAEHKLVRDTADGHTLYDVTGAVERKVQNDAVHDRLSTVLDRTLDPLPAQRAADEFEIQDHVKEHLQEMGYM